MGESKPCSSAQALCHCLLPSPQAGAGSPGQDLCLFWQMHAATRRDGISLEKERPGVRVLLRDTVGSQECCKSSGYKAGEQHSALPFPLLTISRGAAGINTGHRG